MQIRKDTRNTRQIGLKPQGGAFRVLHYRHPFILTDRLKVNVQIYKSSVSLNWEVIDNFWSRKCFYKPLNMGKVISIGKAQYVKAT